MNNQNQIQQSNQTYQMNQSHQIIYTAQEGERLDSIYFKYFKSFHQEYYDSFLQDNHKLLYKDILEAGDKIVVNMIETAFKDDVTKGLYGIEA